MGGPGWWINLFKDLSELGLFNISDPAHHECIQFCFKSLSKKELSEVAEKWNQHLIALSNFGSSSGPRGRPDMFLLPHLDNSEHYTVPWWWQELYQTWQ